MTSPSQTAVQFNLAKAFDVLVESLADRECIVWRDRRLSYGDVATRSKRLASYLHERGLGVRRERDELQAWESGQDHLALALYNGNEYLEGMLGSYGARVAPFNVNYRYVGEELRYLLNDARPRAMILHSSLAATLAEVLPTLDSPPDVLLQVEDEPGHDLLPGAVWYEEALAASSPEGAPVGPSPDDLYILYTGGTTGMPKGVLWRQHDIFMAAMGGRKVGTWEIVTSYGDLTTRLADSVPLRLVVLPPLMHGAAQWACFMLMAQGATLLFPDDTHRVDPDDVWTVVEREKGNTMTIVGDAVLRPLLLQLDKKTVRPLVLLRRRQRRRAAHAGGACHGHRAHPEPRDLRLGRLLGDRRPDARHLRRRRRGGDDSCPARARSSPTSPSPACSSRGTRATAGWRRPGTCRSGISATRPRRRAPFP